MSDVIKKTVAIRKELDKYIRITWSTLIENGYDATYSYALNFMLLEHTLAMAKPGVHNQKDNEILASFLRDEATIRSINIDDYGTRVDDLLSEQDPKSAKER